MSKKRNNKKSLILSRVCFGHHGQLSVLLQQTRCYFLYKDVLTDGQEKALLNAICLNLKHFLILSKNHDILPYEKNSYAYYIEKFEKKENYKKLFLDLVLSQTLLINEYQQLIKNQLILEKGVEEQIMVESIGCKSLLVEQIRA